MKLAHMSTDIRELHSPQAPRPQDSLGSLGASNFARSKPLYTDPLLISMSSTHEVRDLRSIPNLAGH